LNPIFISFGVTLVCIGALVFLAKRQILNLGFIVAIVGIIVAVNVWSLNATVRAFSVTPFKNRLPVYQSVLYESCGNPQPADGAAVTSGKILPLILDAQSKVVNIDMLLFREYLPKERIPRHTGQVATLVFRREIDTGVVLSGYPGGSKCLQKNYELYAVGANSGACFSGLLESTAGDCPRSSSEDVYAVPSKSAVLNFRKER